MDLGITGRVALVTVASAGLGRATARALADEGCRLVISARTADRLQKAADELSATGVKVIALPGDVTANGAVDRLVAEAESHFERVGILVANIGGPPAARALDFTDGQRADAGPTWPYPSRWSRGSSPACESGTGVGSA